MNDEVYSKVNKFEAMRQDDTPMTTPTQHSHTPTPWEITVVNHNGWTLDGSDRPFLPLYRIGDRDDEIPAKEAMANAALIVRAVNRDHAFDALLAACKALMPIRTKCLRQGQSIGVEFYNEFEAARAAIAEAEGDK